MYLIKNYPDRFAAISRESGPRLLACNPVNPNLTFLAREFIDAGREERMNEPWMNPFALAFLRVSVPSYQPLFFLSRAHS